MSLTSETILGNPRDHHRRGSLPVRPGAPGSPQKRARGVAEPDGTSWAIQDRLVAGGGTW